MPTVMDELAQSSGRSCSGTAKRPACCSALPCTCCRRALLDGRAPPSGKPLLRTERAGRDCGDDLATCDQAPLSEVCRSTGAGVRTASRHHTRFPSPSWRTPQSSASCSTMLRPLPALGICIDVTSNRLSRTEVDDLDHQAICIEADSEHDRRASVAYRIGDELVRQENRGIDELRRARSNDAAHNASAESHRLDSVGKGTLHFVHPCSLYPKVPNCMGFAKRKGVRPCAHAAGRLRTGPATR